MARAAAPPPGTVRIGISGWRYVPWRGVFYPPQWPKRDELAFASRALPTIELNGSFYGLLRPTDYAAWRATVPPGFVFAVKGPQFLTHRLRLKNVRVPLANFFASGPFALGDALGPFLWQFPPRMRFDAARFEAFFALLPPYGRSARALAAAHDARVEGRADVDSIAPAQRLRHAVEIRHESFVTPAFLALLRRHGIALVVADTAGRWPQLFDVTADFVYVHLHGDTELYASGYGEAALDRWAERIGAWRDGGLDVYVYFDNDIKVHAPFDAAALARRLGLETGVAPADGPAPQAPQ